MASHSVEDIKRSSRLLRGTIEDSLADAVTGALRDSDQVVLKYHGSYQQDDRDIREERRRARLEPAHSFMIRTRTPGGVITPEQWLKLDAIATTYAERGLRITTRQAFQFHGVIKRDLKPTMQAINAALIDTLAACGDVNRNVAVAANPLLSALHETVYRQAAALSEHLLPNTRAYYRSGSTKSASPATRASPSTARPTCRASSRSASPFRRTTMSTCSARTSASSRWSRTASSQATTSPSAAAWAAPMAMPKPIHASPTSSGSFLPTT